MASLDSSAAPTQPPAPAPASSPEAAGRTPLPDPLIRQKRVANRRLALCFLLSLLIHGLLLSLTFGGNGIGLPAFALPWLDRRIEAPLLNVVLRQAPIVAEPVRVPVKASPPSASPRPVVAAAPALADAAAAESMPAPAPSSTAPPAQAAEIKAPEAVTKAESVPNSASAPAPATATPGSEGSSDAPSTAAPAAAVIAVKRTETPEFVVPPPPPTPPKKPGKALAPSVDKTATQAPHETGEAKRTQAETEVGKRAVKAEGPEPSVAVAAEAERREAARQAAEKAEAQRQEAAQTEAARQEAERQEAARLAAEKAEAQRLEAARLAAAKAEAQRQEEAQAEAARQEAKRLEAARLAAEKAEAQRQEAARLAAAKAEAQRQEEAQAEAARQEAERQEAARLAAEKAEAQRQEAIRQEAARVEMEKQQAAQAEAAKAEAARAQEEREEDERREARRRAMGRILDEEAARREAAMNSDRFPQPPYMSRRIRLWGRTDPNAELIKYAEAWERRIQFNTPVDVVRGVASRPHNNPMVTVAIRSDGYLEGVTFVTSSGVPEVDEAIRRIVYRLVPYQAFPPDLARDYDVVEIRRTWSFDMAVRLY